MKELVAKRYVKALVLASKDIENYANILNNIAKSFENEKFKDIIVSPEVANNDKVDIILGSIKNADNGLKNFIQLLGEKSRLNLIEDIAKELNYQLALKKNQFTGVVFSNKKLTQAQVNKLQTSFSQKLDSKIILTQEIGNYDGVKVEINDLGVEIGFSKERLQSQMIEHILKAI